MIDVPLMPVGRYAGTPVDQLPLSYLRWVVMQKFSPEILSCARAKIEKSSYCDTYLNVSRHAIDMFSKRFIRLWVMYVRANGPDSDGLATFVTKMAERAWNLGADVSKHRHQDDGIVKFYEEIMWVFGVSKSCPDYRELITVMTKTYR